MVITPKTYLVCGIHRSGTTVLCDALAQSTVAGRPEEYFHGWVAPHWKKEWGTESFGDYLAAIGSQSATPNGVVGIKIFWSHLVRGLFPGARELLGDGDLSDRDVFDRIFLNVHYIFVRRIDHLRQAISRERAQQTQAWEDRIDKPAVKRREEVFKFDRIEHWLHVIREEEEHWRSFFKSVGADPLELTYEEITMSLDTATRRVLAHIGVRAPDAFRAETTLKKQSDLVTEEWIDEYWVQKTGARVLYVADTN
ncbi:MAG: Stf0 family sulphotransferase [Chloroflexota bacterium]